MPAGADVRSIPAVRDWLAAVAGYRSSASEALAGVDLEIRRAIDWVAEQGQLWQKAVRDCQDEVVQAKSELNRKKWPDATGREPDTTIERRNLKRAEARLEHAEAQVVKCRAWVQKLPRLVDELYTGPSRRLALFLEGELVQGAAVLDRRVEALEAYAGMRPDFAPAPTNLPPAGG